MNTKLLLLLTVGVFSFGCASYQTVTNNEVEVGTLSQISSGQTGILKEDVVKFFCHNLTEYFNTYRYYKITSEVYYEKEKQNRNNNNTIAKIIKNDNLYSVGYIGIAGVYVVSFSNMPFEEADKILTFGRQTVLGNAIRSKIYDTFLAWTFKQETALKINDNHHLFADMLIAALEVERWHNRLSSSEN